MDFQAVVMAAGKGSRMTELTVKCPKALLPVGNRPMIWYSLNFLQRNGFKDAIVVLPAGQKNEIMSVINGLGDIKLHLHEELVQQTAESGTAEALCQVIKNRDIKKSNLLVVSCDFITDASLDSLFALHYTRSSALTLLFTPVPGELRTAAVPGPKTKQKVERDLVGLDRSSQRLVFMTAEADCDDEQLVFRRHALNRCPHFNIYSNLLDAHVYIFNKSIYNLITNERKSSSLKGDVIPLLTRRQFAPREPITVGDVKRNQIGHIEKMSSWIKNSDGVQDDTAHCCHGYIDNQGFSLRANNFATYMYANRQIARLWPTIAPDVDLPLAHPTVQKTGATVGAECFIGKGVTIGMKSVLKGCTIGQECKIGPNVKLTNCVIMDKVTIGDSCVLQGCIIGRDATLEDGCHLKDCVVATDLVAAATKSNNEIILSEGQFMNLSETDSLD